MLNKSSIRRLVEPVGNVKMNVCLFIYFFTYQSSVYEGKANATMWTQKPTRASKNTLCPQ